MRRKKSTEGCGQPHRWTIWLRKERIYEDFRGNENERRDLPDTNRQ